MVRLQTRVRKQRRATTEAEGRKTTEASAAQAAAAGNESNSKREAEATEGTSATDASAAHAAAALDENIEIRQAVATEDQDTNEKDERIRALIQKRKNTAKHEEDQIREISKEIKKNIRDNKRMKGQEKIQNILEKVKGTKNIPIITSVKRRILIPNIRNKDGEAEKTRQGNANVFAKFYEELHKGEDEQDDEDKSSRIDQENVDSSQNETIPEFTKEEIHRLKKGKAKDNSGVRAEQLKICSEDTKEKIRTILNDIARQDDFTPNSWRRIRIQVIHKKGAREDPGNYRPKCGLPILYKLFATILYARLAPRLHKVQPPDQAGFRPNHRCEDHLTVCRILEQRSREWGVPLYISTIDFTKAFDSIKHSAIWDSLRFYGIKPAYVTLLQKLYKRQEGTVLTDKESEVFPIKKGTKQGDTLSSLLFNTVLQYSVENNLTKILEEVKGKRNIPSVKSVKKRILVPKVRKKEGEAVQTRQGIAKVFAKFCDDLYEGEEGYTEKGMDSRTEDEKKQIPANTTPSQSLQKMRFKTPSTN